MKNTLRGTAAGAAALLVFLLLPLTVGAEQGSAPEPEATLPACHYLPPDDGQPIQVATTKTIKLSRTDGPVNGVSRQSEPPSRNGAPEADGWQSYAWAWGTILFVAVGVSGRAWVRGRRGLR